MIRSWEYVAGFFDGEGCVWWCVARSAPQASMTQVLPEVLYDIKDFLDQEKIVCKIRNQRRNVNSFQKTCTNVLDIQGRENCVKFLKALLPHLRTIKRDYAQDVIRFSKLFPKRDSRGRKKGLDKFEGL